GDEKIFAVPAPKLTKRYEHVANYTDLPCITLEQVQHFFEHYKDLEPGKWVKMDGWGDAEEARQLLDEAIARAREPRTDRLDYGVRHCKAPVVPLHGAAQPRPELNMTLIRPVRALRPVPTRAREVIAPPYDVLSSAEARERVKGKFWSFLHVSKAEIDLPDGTDPYAQIVYATAAE